MITSIPQKPYWIVGLVLLIGFNACSRQKSIYKINSSNRDSLCTSNMGIISRVNKLVLYMLYLQ